MTTLIFDLNHIAYRSLHSAHRDIKDAGWQYFKALMLNQVFAMCRKFNPDEVILAVDSKENWRKKFYPEYKQNRKESREKQTDIDWSGFFNAYSEFVNEVKLHFPFYVLQIKYMEADDIIGVLAREWQHKDKVVVTSDQDFLQLLKYKGLKLYDASGSKFLKHDDPEKFLKIKVLMGDRGDNVKPIKPRIGEKTAERYIDEPELLREILDDTTPAYTKPDGTVVTLGEQTKDAFKLNTIMVDLSRTPDVLVKSLMTEIKDYNLPTGNTIFQYFASNKFRELLRKMEDLENILAPITAKIKENQKAAENFGDLFTE